MNRLAWAKLRPAGGRSVAWYYAAAIGLLIVAAALRFYDLPEHYLRVDEAAAAHNSRGTLAEVIANTRTNNSSPILYPLALWAVLKVEASAFSVRVLPAAASVLTVAAMLFLLPRAGVGRGAAMLAALLATVSAAAIWHAQDAREYSVDALLAVLMIAGLLWYLRDGRKALLCASLFIAPLLQYGLVLFGVAVIGAAIVCPPPPPPPDFAWSKTKATPGTDWALGAIAGRPGLAHGGFPGRVRCQLRGYGALPSGAGISGQQRLSVGLLLSGRV